jgi:hypothetical protein
VVPCGTLLNGLLDIAVMLLLQYAGAMVLSWMAELLS